MITQLMSLFRRRGDTGKCRIVMAGPELWRDRVQNCSLLTRSLIQTLHDRHIGITPWLADRLAAALTPHMEELPAAEFEDPWAIAIDRLKLALRVRDSDRHHFASTKGRAVIVSAAPSWFVLHVAAFLLDQACRRTGRTVLFCEDRLLFGISPIGYSEYERAMMAALLEVVRDAENKLDIFWYESAVTLTARARSLSQHAIVKTPLPQTAPVATALLKRLRPILPDDQSDQKTVRRVEQSRPLRTLRKHRRTDGINGVTMTRSIEDLSNIMLTELTLPSLMRMQRLMNEGYLSRYRPPKQEQNRDVLLALLVPGSVRDTLPGAFAKACWFNLCLQLGRQLCQSGLYQTEFRLIEGDRLGMLRSEVFPLGALSTPDLVKGDAASEFYRHDFLNSLQWLPRFFDEQGMWSEPVQVDGDCSTPSGSSFADWCASAWKSQLESPSMTLASAAPTSGTKSSSSGRSNTTSRRKQSQRRSNAVAVSDFKFVHLMVLCPNSLAISSQAISHSLLKRRILRSVPPSASLSITWLPDEMQTSDWRFDVGVGRSTLIDGVRAAASNEAFVSSNDGVEGSDDVSQFAGGLVGTWLQHIRNEIWQG